MGSPQQTVPTAARALLWTGCAVVVAYVVWTIPGVRRSPGFSVPYDGVLQATGYVLVAAAVVVGYRLRAVGLLAWRLLALAVLLRAAGFVTALYFLGSRGSVPTLSVADGFWFAGAVALVAVVLVRFHQLARRPSLLVVLDGVAAALFALGVAVAVLVRPVGELTEASDTRRAVLVNLGYPVLDVVLVVSVTALVVTASSLPGLADVLLVTGSVALTVVDVGYVLLLAHDAWRPGTLLSSLSLVATATLAAAVWNAARPPMTPRRAPGQLAGRGRVLGPSAPAVGLAIALAGVFVGERLGLSSWAVLCFLLTGLVALARGLLTYRAYLRDTGIVISAAHQDVRLFQGLVEASTDFIGLADASGHVLYINPAGRRMLKLAPDADLGDLTAAGTVQTSRDAFERRWADILTRGHWEGESALQPLDGSEPVPVAAATFALPSTSGSPDTVATIQRDIRERLGAEAALQDLADQRARLLGRLVQAQEDERLRIAADVHDDSVQALAAVDLRLGALRRQLDAEASPHLAALDALQETVTNATTRLRHLLFDLESPARRATLADALSEAAEFVFEDTAVRWSLTGEIGVDVPEAARVTAYRVAKEALVNARKHSGCRTVVMHLGAVSDDLVLAIRDDGRGITEAEVVDRPGHLGLGAMRDRVTVAGGELVVRPLRGGGTEVVLRLPGAVHGSAGGAPAAGPGRDQA